MSIITNNSNNYNAIYMLNNLFSFIKGQLRIHDTQLLDSISEIEYSMNSMSSKTISSLFEIGSSGILESSSSLSSTEIVSKQDDLKESCHHQNSLAGSDSITVPYKIRLDANKKFRRQMYELRDDSFSVFSKNSEENTLILPFQIRYLEISGLQTCLYGMKLSFNSSNNSLEVDPVYIPFLKSQTVQEFEEEDIDEKIIDKYLEETNSKVISLNNNMFLLLLIARVKFPIPGKLHIRLEFNDELGQTFYDQLEDIQITFQDYFHPSPTENWILKCYQAISQSSEASEMVNTCKLLEISSNLVLRNINKHLRIFEINANDLFLFNDKFNITEEFDFKHDLLINQSSFKGKNTEDNCDFQVNYRWFCIHLLPKYYLIIQFSITRKSSIIRIYTDFPEILSHCDNFFDSWTYSLSQSTITYR